MTPATDRQLIAGGRRDLWADVVAAAAPSKRLSVRGGAAGYAVDHRAERPVGLVEARVLEMVALRFLLGGAAAARPVQSRVAPGRPGQVPRSGRRDPSLR